MVLFIHTSYPQAVKMNYNKMLSNRYKLVIDKTLDFMLNMLDITRYDEPVTRTKKSKRFQRMKLSNFQNLKLINKSKVKKLNNLRLKTNKKKSAAVLIVVTSVITQGNTYAYSLTNTDHYKLYLHSKIISEKQYKCADYVAHIESRWSPVASNNGHYGLFQMQNKRVKYLNAYQQIDMWLKYVAHRYDNKPCKAMWHLKKRNWQ